MALTIINRKSKKEISQRKKEIYSSYSKIIQWGRAYPVEFCSRFFGIELLDYQKYIIYNSWFGEFLLWLVCRNGGKSAIMDIYSMLRSVLIPFHTTYILGNTGEQSKETFKKLEKIAKREIDSFVGCTDIFFNELERRGGISDGFIHDPASFKTVLFNGASINTLNSDIINIKGKRANLVEFDEAGWFSDELFVQAENFVNQDENFKLGGGKDISLEPKGFPLQLLYASSASDTSSEFYKKLRNFTSNMLIGNRKYFACNFTIDSILSAKFNGEEYPPLLSKDKVDKAIADNSEKAMRELYNKFSADLHEGQILTPRDIRQSIVNRPPLLTNDTGSRRFIFAWDSARINDNSVILVAELREDKKKGLCLDLHNIKSLVDVDSKKKSPMRTPEQVKEFKKLLLEYNGANFQKLDYENIEMVICDSGSGGQMIGGIADYLLEDWTDEHGIKHKGLIDDTHKAYQSSKYSYPNASNILKLVEPKGNRNAIFDSLQKMVKLGVVTFPAEWDGKDFLYFVNEDGTDEKYDLNPDEKIALGQIELLKNEIVTMCKYENAGNITYNYPPDKRYKMHDDRVFAFGLLCFMLAKLRHGSVINKPSEDLSSNMFVMRPPKKYK